MDIHENNRRVTEYPGSIIHITGPLSAKGTGYPVINQHINRHDTKEASVLLC